MNIINLDQLVPDDKTIILAGKEWVIPSDLPVEYMLRLMKVQQAIEKDGENMDNQEDAFRVAHEVFTIRHPELSLGDFNKMITLKQFSILMASLFGNFESTEEAETAIEDVQKKTLEKVTKE